MVNEEDRRAHEVELAQRFAEELSVEQFARWNLLKVGHRVSIHYGAVLMLWKARADGSPEILNWFTVTRVGMLHAAGLELELTDRYAKITRVSNKPVALHDSLFVGLPFYNEVRWLPNSKDPRQMILRTALTMRMKSNPKRWVAGDVYLTPVAEFRAAWPQYKDQRY